MNKQKITKTMFDVCLDNLIGSKSRASPYELLEQGKWNKSKG